VAKAIRLILGEQDKLEGRLKRLENSASVVAPTNELEEMRRQFEGESSQGGEIRLLR
jgi:hypothetical protein